MQRALSGNAPPSAAELRRPKPQRQRPRTDVTDTTTFSYYADTTATLGDLATITDALNHTSQITSYDKNGRPLTVIEPNGVTLTFNYWPRGRLKTCNVTDHVQLLNAINFHYRC